MKKMFTENLIKWGKGGKAKEGSINWKLNIGSVVKFIYDDIEGEVTIINYNRDYLDKGYLDIIYLDKDIFNLYAGSFLECKIGKLLGKKTKDFKIEIGAKFKDDKRNFTIIDREYRQTTKENEKWYKYKCNNCGWDEGWIIEHALQRGNGCSCCSHSSKTVVEGINDIPTTAPWMVKFFQGGYDEAKLYSRQSSKKIFPICPDCDRIKDKSMNISDINKNIP